jgi:glycosyltransferase involved in cell wall biosynthesis
VVLSHEPGIGPSLAVGTALMKRRVVHYVDSDEFGGSEEAALQLMASLDRSRWEPVLMHHSGPGVARLVHGASSIGLRTVAVPRLRRGPRIAGVPRLWRELSLERPAVFHAHLTYPRACQQGVLAAWLARVPAVATAHLYVAPRLKIRTRPMLRLLRRIIAVSEEVKTRYARELQVPVGRLSVVRNGIRLPPCIPSPDPALRADLVRDRPAYLVLTPARLHPQKGHEYLLAAAAMVPEATFILAGEGPLRAELEARARGLGIANRCLFLGHRSDVLDLLVTSDVFVLPSLYEGLPISVLEAMAAQRPVVATAIGGTNEAVIHEVTGLLVPPRDPATLAGAIRRLRTDPALAKRLSVAARKRVEQEFSIVSSARNVMRIYDEVLGEVQGGVERACVDDG